MLREKACRAAVAILLGASTVSAQTEEPSDMQIHGFVSQGYIKTTRNNYLTDSARRQGSFDFTEVGINFTKQLNDKLRVGLQLFAHDLGPLGNYSPQFDWYYLDYHLFDWLGIRAGKTSCPGPVQRIQRHRRGSRGHPAPTIHLPGGQSREPVRTDGR